MLDEVVKHTVGDGAILRGVALQELDVVAHQPLAEHAQEVLALVLEHLAHGLGELLHQLLVEGILLVDALTLQLVALGVGAQLVAAGASLHELFQLALHHVHQVLLRRAWQFAGTGHVHALVQRVEHQHHQRRVHLHSDGLDQLWGDRAPQLGQHLLRVLTGLLAGAHHAAHQARHRRGGRRAYRITVVVALQRHQHLGGGPHERHEAVLQPLGVAVEHTTGGGLLFQCRRLDGDHLVLHRQEVVGVILHGVLAVKDANVRFARRALEQWLDHGGQEGHKVLA
mmetsp:Transcript_50436/g.126633  ORF Transcript_50436/g.126633 Transcript_50436/m.126633 type:complete len:283 (+) Transcript_50436:669-1517(+)